MENLQPVKDISIGSSVTAAELARQLKESGGFTATAAGAAVDILETMFKETNCLKFLSFPADIIATGTRGIIRDMVKEKKFDVLITTCGTLDHDIARSFKEYYHGDWLLDDADLRRRKISRLGNVLVPDESYGDVMEQQIPKYLEELAKQGITDISTHELCWFIGSKLSDSSILYWAWKNKIPVIIPGPTDGSVGYQIWQYSQDHKFSLNLLKDEQLLSDLVWNSKKMGALILGGGISKHHVIWWAQFRGGLDHAVYITTAAEWDGSLSGAHPREAVSWGKINEKAKTCVVPADITLALPLIWAAVMGRM